MPRIVEPCLKSSPYTKLKYKIRQETRNIKLRCECCEFGVALWIASHIHEIVTPSNFIRTDDAKKLEGVLLIQSSHEIL